MIRSLTCLVLQLVFLSQLKIDRGSGILQNSNGSNSFSVC
jgi:hypothetical protein